jgi:hypothetical protein
MDSFFSYIAGCGMSHGGRKEHTSDAKQLAEKVIPDRELRPQRL